MWLENRHPPYFVPGHVASLAKKGDPVFLRCIVIGGEHPGYASAGFQTHPFFPRRHWVTDGGLQNKLHHEMSTNVELSQAIVCIARTYLQRRNGGWLGDRIQFKSKSRSEHHMHSCATEPSALCEYSLSSPSYLRGISLEILYTDAEERLRPN